MIKEHTTVSQLVDIYLKEEWWHNTKLSYDEAVKYHQKMLDRGNIITYEEKGEVLGYVEVWKLTFEQFGRIICGAEFNPFDEDTTSGYVAYVANIWVHPQQRDSIVIKILRTKFFTYCFKCGYFVGEARRKKCGLIKVFRQPEFFNKYIVPKIGEEDGQR